jgi:hypothetical protein
MSAKTVFACTHITKDATEDNFETGCDMKRTCVMSERVNFTASTMENLVKGICDQYGLEFPDNVWHDADHDMSQCIDVIAWNRHETATGDTPTAEQLDRWKRGEMILYVADYTCCVEKRRVEPVDTYDMEGLPCDE